MFGRLGPLFQNDEHASLHFHPTLLSMTEIIFSMILLILKSVLNGLMVLIGGTGSQGRPGSIKTEVPKLSVSMPFRLTKQDIEQYMIATGSSRDAIEKHKVIKALFLSAATEPCMLLVMVKQGCPIQPLGSVNVRNSFEILRPDLCSLDFLEEVEGGMVFSTLESPARIMKRGLEYDLSIEFRVPSKSDPNILVPVFRQIHTLLQFTKIPASAKLAEITREPEFQFQLMGKPRAGQTAVGYSDPTKWARLCKDYNPIHISGIAAKLYGLPGKIAHGNHVAALALKEILNASEKESGAPLRLEVSFKRPVTVPGKLDILVEFKQKQDSSITHYAIARGEKVCVQGKFWEISGPIQKS
ncbi:hypothetical protein TWF694_007591 [Orbilia ellipsospora]|uniref:MaoC-like domain-containing protein n=1 Tax=Orbilia ellipsospora TaxID=2528407 RepID=A0AAV9XI62_9PEZI